ncbi:MAG: Bug family tripartite tricarboxylate transporter substrate binding protein [Advenella sp.]|uniref:ABC transporter substrate-binding protein n=1 Tax=Advenella kashmirensis TaxID=310575 RepID=A0A356LD93_9BURK|nr:tripartite tricarboxylate transporter substrate binding protein [Advenella sp. FME57]HBP28799.1 ABC transporter substrate-binding protein [Advenella kashmirensis]
MKTILPISSVMAALLLCTGVQAADTQTFPNKPLRMVVPFAPGGGADMTARIISETLAKKLGQPVVVENKAGAGATIGAAYVARSAPDGYTILYTTPGPQITNPNLMKSLPYEPDDLKPVSKVSIAPSVLVINSNLPVKSVDELIALARDKPGQIRYASAGIGASSHLNGELLQTMAKIKLQHVPYKGTGEALKDLVGGNTDMAIDTLAVYMPYIKSGKLTALGVTTPTALDLLPGIEPIGKSLPGYDASPMNYLSVPAKTPDSIVSILNKAVNDAIKEPEVKDKLLQQGILAEGSSQQEIEALIGKEQLKWQKVIDGAGLSPK